MKTGIFYIIDDTNSQNGITDRLKVAVGLYYVAKKNDIGFYFIHQAGFDIRDYLLPNKVDWSAGVSEISKLPWKTQKIRYNTELLDMHFDPAKQYICKKGIGKNIIEMTGVPDWQRIWRELFRELFKPDEKVLQALAERSMPERYSVVNARFINSLGTFETADYNAPLPEKEQELLIEKVLLKVKECEQDSDAPIVVLSDSVKFLKAAQENGFRIFDPDGIGHIMNRGIGERVYLDTFVNFFLTARAEKIYSILNVDGVPDNSLYKTQYPRYAAIIGDKPFIRL